MIGFNKCIIIHTFWLVLIRCFAKANSKKKKRFNESNFSNHLFDFTHGHDTCLCVLSPCAEPVRKRPNKLQRVRHPRAPPKSQLITLGGPPPPHFLPSFMSLIHVLWSSNKERFFHVSQTCSACCTHHHHQSEHCIIRRHISISSHTESPTDWKVKAESKIVQAGLIIAASEDGLRRLDAALYWTTPPD